jgi:hypothetical protein
MTDHPYVCTCDKCVDAGGGIPNFLRRAPFTPIERMPHVVEFPASPETVFGLDLAKPGSDRSACTCGLMSGECKRAGCPYKELDVPEYVDDAIDQCPINRGASPPASFPWERPPSGSKS